MASSTRDANQLAKARQRRRRNAQERREQDRCQAQYAAEALQQTLDDLGLLANRVTEIAGRLRSQQQLLGKIFGMMFPPLFDRRTTSELCRVRATDHYGRLVGEVCLPDGSSLNQELVRAGLVVSAVHAGRHHPGALGGGDPDSEARAVECSAGGPALDVKARQ
jgi:hypothetical protein